MACDSKKCNLFFTRLYFVIFYIFSKFANFSGVLSNIMKTSPLKEDVFCPSPLYFTHWYDTPSMLRQSHSFSFQIHLLKPSEFGFSEPLIQTGYLPQMYSGIRWYGIIIDETLPKSKSPIRLIKKYNPSANVMIDWEASPSLKDTFLSMFLFNHILE